MTSKTSKDRKSVAFASPTVEKDYKNLPPDVFETANYATSSLQNKFPLPKGQAEDLKGSLKGITEIKIMYNNDTYRVYYAASFPTIVYILDAGMKKSHKNSEIPKEQQERLKERLKQAKQHYAENKDRLAQEAHVRVSSSGQPETKKIQ